MLSCHFIVLGLYDLVTTMDVKMKSSISKNGENNIYTVRVKVGCFMLIAPSLWDKTLHMSSLKIVKWG